MARGPSSILAVILGSVPLLFASVLPPPTHAAVLHVRSSAPGPVHDGKTWATAYPSIQPALDAASPGDEVWVDGGTYRGGLTLRTARVGLYGGFTGSETERGQRIPTWRTDLWPQSTDPILTLAPEAEGAVVDGFELDPAQGIDPTGLLCQAKDVVLSRNTVRNCGGIGAAGGGIVCDPGSSVTVTGCEVRDNAAKDGGGILARDADLKITSCIITGNEALFALNSKTDYTAYSRGGGIAVFRGRLDLQDSTIAGNLANGGGGLWAENAAVTLTRNVVRDNTAYRDATQAWWVVQTEGGGATLRGGNAIVRNNLFARNELYANAVASLNGQAHASGGGLSYSGAEGEIVNNTFADNLASATGSATDCQGGGLTAGTNGPIANNVFSGNRTTRAPAGSVTTSSLSTSNLGSVVANLFGGETEFTGWDLGYGPGNIWANVTFLPGDPPYRLAPNSRGVDAGESSFALPGETDLSGNPRIRGARVDMGAYEADVPAAPARVYVSPDGDDTRDGTSWATAKRTIAAALRVVGVDGSVWVREGTYSGLYAPSRVALYGGFSGSETSLEERDIRAHPTVLDDERAGYVVNIPSYRAGVILDGFTLRNGGSTSFGLWEGGGILSEGRDVVISHNIIEHNTVSVADDNPFVSCNGILASVGPVTITNNIIRETAAGATQVGYPQFSSMVGASSTGICVYSAEVTVANNIVSNLYAVVGGMPSGYFVDSTGISASNVTGRIVNNTVADTRADVRFSLSPAPDLSAVGIWLAGDNTGLLVANNIVASNSIGIGSRTDSGNVTLSHNAFWDNAKGDVTGLPDPIGTHGNVRTDPLFVNTATGDYHIRPESPLRNAGDNSAAVGTTDIDGEPRIREDTVDIGADETVFTDMGSVALALRVAAGLATAPLAELDADASGSVTLADAILHLRILTSRDPRP